MEATLLSAGFTRLCDGLGLDQKTTSGARLRGVAIACFRSVMRQTAPSCRRAGGAPGAASTPSGCCSPTGCGRPQAACRRRSGAAGRAGALFVLDLGLDVLDRVRRLNLERHGLARE